MFSAFFYLCQRSFINRIKKAFQEPKQMLAQLIILVPFVLIIASLFTRPSAPAANQGALVLKQGAFLLAYFMLQLVFFSGLFINGLFKTSMTFQPADITFLFTAPVQSQSNLIFGFLRSLPATLLGGFFILYQAGNLMRSGFTLSSVIIAALFFGWNIFVTGSLAMLSFAQVKKRPRSLALILGLFVLLIVGLLLFILGRLFWTFQGFNLESLNRLFEEPLIRLFPLLGWSSSVIYGLLNGFDLYAFAGLILSLLCPLLALFLLYRTRLDYYEEAIAMTRSRQESEQVSKQGFAESLRIQQKKKASSKAIKTEGIGRGYGAKTQYYRLLLEERRLAKLPIWLKRQAFSLILLVAYSVLYLLFPEQRELFNFGLKNFGFLILLTALSLLQLINSSSTLVLELNQAQFYLLPVKSSSLIFYSILPALRNALLSSLPALTVLTGLALWRQSPLAAVSLAFSLSFAVLSLNGLGFGLQVIIFYIFGELKSSLSNLLLVLAQLSSILPIIILTVSSLVKILSQFELHDLNYALQSISPSSAYTIAFKFLLLALVQSLFFGLTISLGARLLRRGR
ncbi:MAG: putative ABC exporter domain-containing protein [Eubacteriales bacterium]|nr:putative ABC exporter domain-containing protein [Eubacteriales bacterium]